MACDFWIHWEGPSRAFKYHIVCASAPFLGKRHFLIFPRAESTGIPPSLPPSLRTVADSSLPSIASNSLALSSSTSAICERERLVFRQRETCRKIKNKNRGGGGGGENERAW